MELINRIGYNGYRITYMGDTPIHILNKVLSFMEWIEVSNDLISMILNDFPDKDEIIFEQIYMANY